MEEQKRLFEIIKTRMPEQYRLADVIEELLGVSSDSAYRRIRGEKELSFSEMVKICKHFNVSVDEVINHQSEQGALFQYTTINLANQDSYVNYIRRLSAILTGLKSASEKELIYTAQDIPFYHFLKYTELLLFKVYAWNDTLTKTHILFKDFCDKLNKDAIIPIYEQMASSYDMIPSKEIWTDQTIDTILRLLDYHMETGAFDTKETVLFLLNQLSLLLDTVNKSAEHGHKGNDKKTPFSLYLSSVDLGNNFMLTRNNGQLACNIRLYTINSITTNNASLCTETEEWISDLISKSVLISGTSSRERFRFFQTSKNKIANLMNKIELAEMF